MAILAMGDYKSISLFSGANGLDIGLSQAGIDIAIGQDADAACCATMLLNGRPCVKGDVRAVDPADMLAAAGLAAGEPFLVCGGPPCQPFSTAGKRLGTNDPRGSLFVEFVRMVGAMRPRFFVMENVKGLLSSKLKGADGKDTDTGVLDVILEAFDGIGYKVAYGLLDAVNYGVPQFRERFVAIGSRDGEDVFLPIPTHFPVHQRPGCRWATSGSAIRDLEASPGECARLSAEREKYLRMIPEGGNWRDLPDGAKEAAMGGAFSSGGGKAGFYRRLSYSQPAPTLVTSPTQKATLMGHPVRDRVLSVAEYARIQQFPDGWALAGSLQDKYRQLGNAVPVGLARAIGEAVMAAARGDAEVRTRRFRGTGVHSRIQAAMAVGREDS